MHVLGLSSSFNMQLVNKLSIIKFEKQWTLGNFSPAMRGLLQARDGGDRWCPFWL
jgi:hypothetical protein